MRTFSEIVNELLTNHLTPVLNIVTMVTNLYTFTEQIVVKIDDEGTGIIMNSHRFKDSKTTSTIISWPIYKGQSISGYIQQCGLDTILILPVDGQQSEFYVHFTASDLKKTPSK